MVGAYIKTVFRTIKSQIGQFLAMTAIIILGVGFSTGIGATAPNMRATVDGYFTEHAVPDIIVKAPQGFTHEQTAFLSAAEDIAAYEELTSFDTDTDGVYTRLYFMPLGNRSVDKLELTEGRYPESAGEVLIERGTKTLKAAEVGEQLSLMGQTVTVCGTVINPLYFSKEGEVGSGGKRLRRIVYFDSTFMSMPQKTDAFIRLSSARSSVFSDSYKALIGRKTEILKSASTEANPLIFLSLEQNASTALLAANADRIDAISYIFPIFFVLVSGLVVLSTMTRLVEKERQAIGCYKTLGYGSGKIIFKYLLFALICSLTGCAAGIAGGFRLLPSLVFNVYRSMFYFPSLSYGFYFAFGFIVAGLMTVAILGVTLYVAAKTLRSKPAELLRHKAPKSGKRLFLERIPAIWNRLKFKNKSTFRNVFRYIKHLIMTVISIAGCFALIFAGLALYESISGSSSGATSTAKSMLDAMVFIVLILIISAGTLSVIVVYCLTNINIEERRREIATLKVLGYKNTEVAGYIYREVFILTLFGVLAGLPLGWGLLSFVLDFMDTGVAPVAGIGSWLGSVALISMFTVVTALFLYRKIKGVDMNTSLKSHAD